jgi:hypothetical protein
MYLIADSLPFALTGVALSWALPVLVGALGRMHQSQPGKLEWLSIASSSPTDVWETLPLPRAFDP